MKWIAYFLCFLIFSLPSFASADTESRSPYQQVYTLAERADRCDEHGLKRVAYKMRWDALTILLRMENDLDVPADPHFSDLKQTLVQGVQAFQEECEEARISRLFPKRRTDEDLNKEKEALQRFYEDKPVVLSSVSGSVVPLDGLEVHQDLPYRFLICKDLPIPSVNVRVFKEDLLVDEEIIHLPLPNTPEWHQMLTSDGVLVIPNTRLEKAFGLEVRIKLFYGGKSPFGYVFSTKQSFSEAGYTFTFSEIDEDLFHCHFLLPLPRQCLDFYRPRFPRAHFPLDPPQSKPEIAHATFEKLAAETTWSFPILDQLVKSLRHNPRELAQYVQNYVCLEEWALQDEVGVYSSPRLRRSPEMTFLDRCGSPAEQCELLTYLLKKAGYPAMCVIPEMCTIPTLFAEKLFLRNFPEGREEVQVNYPFVWVEVDGEFHSLFPWLKEMQISEGFDLYGKLPPEYGSADLWARRFLQLDERIYKNESLFDRETPATLFSKFVNSTLEESGLSPDDVGMRRDCLKRTFGSWDSFPRGKLVGNCQAMATLNFDQDRQAQIELVAYPSGQASKGVRTTLYLTELTMNPISIHFFQNGFGEDFLQLSIDERPLMEAVPLSALDEWVTLEVSYIADRQTLATKQFTLSKWAIGSLALDFGGTSPNKRAIQLDSLQGIHAPEERIDALLAFVGSTYFEESLKGRQVFADLHKITVPPFFGVGLVQLEPMFENGELSGWVPKLDMHRIDLASPLGPNEDRLLAQSEYEVLSIVNDSALEHLVIEKHLGSSEAISSVKLLQQAYVESVLQGDLGTGFNALSENAPNQAMGSTPLEEAIVDFLRPDSPSELWNRSYFTLISNGYGGALTFGLGQCQALLSNDFILSNGGQGSPLPPNYQPPEERDFFEELSFYYGFYCHLPLSNLPDSLAYIDPPLLTFDPPQVVSDVRSENMGKHNVVADPIDVVTGAFYIDEVDIALPGDFPLSIRRNYNSQNPVPGELGVGWKLSLNPYLVERDDKRYVAEADGSVICYRYNLKSDRFEVYPEENPRLFNFNKNGIGSSASLYHAYMEGDVLTGADGSKKVFSDGLLRKWTNHRGKCFTFSYLGDTLIKIESDHDQALYFSYDSNGNIQHITTHDGRYVHYQYDILGNLTGVYNSNGLITKYEYDPWNRITKETTSDKNYVENIYDHQGRVIEQYSPIGDFDERCLTAQFEYTDGQTIVTDGEGGQTTYKTYDQQIYKIIDPLGHTITQSWYIDEDHYFDADREEVLSCEEVGFARSLKKSTDRRGLSTTYTYDDRGNPITETTSGKGELKRQVERTFNSFNQCISEQFLNHSTSTEYSDQFFTLPCRIKHSVDNQPISLIEYEYDSHGNLIRLNDHNQLIYFKYDEYSNLCEKIEVTDSEDENVITKYTFTSDGKCTQIHSSDSIEQFEYDLSGRLVYKKFLSSQYELLSGQAITYHINGQISSICSLDPDSALSYSYYPSGQVKGVRREWDGATTRYRYDTRGFLIEELDPAGHLTTTSYDGVGNLVTCETEGYLTQYEYDPGGLPTKITYPDGSNQAFAYSPRGELIAEYFPDGTKVSYRYDPFGRQVQETTPTCTWLTSYDEVHYRTTQTHRETGLTNITEYDAAGNAIRLIDPQGNQLVKTYDGLGRVISQTQPSGQTTTWRYVNDKVACVHPSDEIHVTRYALGQPVEQAVFLPDGEQISYAANKYDPYRSVEISIVGDQKVTTWKNPLGLPKKVEQGSLQTTYQYDKLGNCTAIQDGQGQLTRQEYDCFGRLIFKQSPDGSQQRFTYDKGSNLIAHELPNGNIWKASYDSMHRKTSEAIYTGSKANSKWTYTYKNGNLTKVTAPTGEKTHLTYDTQDRLTQEKTGDWLKAFEYDTRGLLIRAR